MTVRLRSHRLARYLDLRDVFRFQDGVGHEWHLPVGRKRWDGGQRAGLGDLHRGQRHAQLPRRWRRGPGERWGGHEGRWRGHPSLHLPHLLRPQSRPSEHPSPQPAHLSGWVQPPSQSIPVRSLLICLGESSLPVRASRSAACPSVWVSPASQSEHPGPQPAHLSGWVQPPSQSIPVRSLPICLGESSLPVRASRSAACPSVWVSPASQSEHPGPQPAHLSGWVQPPSQSIPVRSLPICLGESSLPVRASPSAACPSVWVSPVQWKILLKALVPSLLIYCNQIHYFC